MKGNLFIKFLLLFLILAALFTASISDTQAQTRHLGLDIVSAAGGSANGTGSMRGISVSWTIGDIVTNEGKNSRKWLLQGFQQGILDTIKPKGYIDTLPPAGLEMIEEKIFIVSVYPNPVENELNYYIHSQETFVFDVALIDINGRVIFDEKKRNSNNKYTYYLNDKISGVYFLRISLPQYRTQKVYKIIKQ
jgi:hypothetical protein